MTLDDIKKITLKLLDYCRANDWAGWDPYDALNSPVFKYLPFLDSKWPRIAFTQFLKRSPINFRPILGIPKTENPKAIALILMSFQKLKKMGLLEDESLIDLMIQKLIDLRSPNNLINNNSQLASGEDLTHYSNIPSFHSSSNYYSINPTFQYSGFPLFLSREGISGPKS